MNKKSFNMSTAYIPGVPEKMFLGEKCAYLTKEHFLGHPVDIQ